MKVLLLFGTPTLFLPYLRSLAVVQGVSLAGVFRACDSQTARRSRHLRRRYEVSEGADAEAELQAVESAVRDFQPDVVLAVCDAAHELLARHHERLSKLPCLLVPTVPMETLRDGRDKLRLSCVLQRHDLPHPQTFLLSEFEAIASQRPTSGPWLLKPANLNGGKGIILFPTAAETVSYLISEKLDPEEFVVQEWIEGQVVNCNVLCQGGRILAHTTHRSLETAKNFTPHYEMQFGQDTDALPIVARLMLALNWNGLANLDLIRERETGRLLILEVNARAWSSLLGSTAAGVNFPWICCQLAQGEEFATPEYRDIRFKLRLDAARQMASAWLQFRRPRFVFHETDLPYTLRDPWPELYGCLRQVGRRFSLAKR